MSTGWLDAAYDSLKGRAVWLYASLGIFLALCLALFLNTPLRTDIQVMLPRGDDSRLAEDFALLAESGLSSNVFISVHADGGATKEDLVAAAVAVEQGLPEDLVTLMDARSINPLKVMDFILDNAPNLLGDEDMQRLRGLLEPRAVAASLADAKRELATPKGWVLKNAIRKDPLNIRGMLFPRLREYQSLASATVSNGHLFSPDQTAILITGRSPLPITDADGAARLVAAFDALNQTLPPHTSAELISGLVHTHVNATTIKRDILTVSLVALGALVLLFLLFFRTVRVAGVFIAPLISLVAGMGGLALFHSQVSAIVIGFGSVLIGISIDFSMHVYFAIARHDGSPGQAVQATARPVLFCTLTSCAAFGALYLSGMPGINQLATFAISGLIVAALFALLVLPQMSSRASVSSMGAAAPRHAAQHPAVALGVIACLLLGCVWFGSSVRLDPDLRSIGYVSDDLRRSEQRFNETWGDVRNKGVIFATDGDMDSLLTRNEGVYRTLAEELPGTAAVSLAPLLPAPSTQQARREAWQRFWTPERRETTIDTIHEEGRELGFSAKAFGPFEQSLTDLPDDITPATLDGAGLGFLADLLVPANAAQPTVITLVPDSDALQAVFSPEKEAELGVRLVSNDRLKHELEAAMKADIKYFITASGLATALLVIFLFRDVRRPALALLPAVVGIGMVFGVLGATGTPLNLFHITALPLVIGLGVDYGIFLVNHEAQPLELATLPAVRASGLTTLASFGILILGKHPSLSSLGITVSVGIGAALLCALYVMPHLIRRQP